MALILISIGCLATASAQSQINWPLTYKNKSANNFIWDKRTKELIKKTIPNKLARNLLRGLGGPPDPVYITKERYFSTSACVPHYCPQKSFYWLDTVTGEALGAVLIASLELGSVNINANKIPTEAMSSLLQWLSENDISPRKVTFYDSNNNGTLLAVSEFKPKVKFTPGENGPSFECKKASTIVEKTICSNDDASKLDLRMASLFHKIRKGHSNLSNLRDFVEFQKTWLRQRNFECSKSNEIENCLINSYKTQIDRLRNWTPER